MQINSKKHKAFSLAEVFLTLAVIGVIATESISILAGTYQETQL